MIPFGSQFPSVKWGAGEQLLPGEVQELAGITGLPPPSHVSQQVAQPAGWCPLHPRQLSALAHSPRGSFPMLGNSQSHQVDTVPVILLVATTNP